MIAAENWQWDISSMGAACCVAARDRTLNHGSSGEILQRNISHSASWSLRWDNRVGVAGEDTSIGWVSDVGSRNDALDVKSATDVSAHVSDGGSSLDSYKTGTWRKSPLPHEHTENIRSLASDQFIAKSAPTEVKTESPKVSIPTSVRQSPSTHTASSSGVSPLPSQSHPLRVSPIPSRCGWAQGSPRLHPHQQQCDVRSSARSSPMEVRHAPSTMSVAGNESTRGSFRRSFDGWSVNAFSDVKSASHQHQSDVHSSGRNSPMEDRRTPYTMSVASTESTIASFHRTSDVWSADAKSASHRRCSFYSDTHSFTQDKSSKASCQNSGSISMEFPTCGICSKLLSEKSAWSSQKIGVYNEIAVVAVLICGHVYHAECLETITPEFNKYDPACPVCTFGEEQTLKLTGKMLKAEKDFKARNRKKLKNLVMASDGSFDFDYWQSGPLEGKSPKLISSSSLKISSAKPFLKRHFSFGSRSNKSASEGLSIRKKGLFWAKSSRV